MFWTEEKLEQRIKELEGYRYRERVEMKEWRMQPDPEGRNGVVTPPVVDSDAMLRQGERWKGRGIYMWLQQRAVVPASWQGRRALGLFDFGKTGAGHNSGFESLLYVNGVPFQGVDSNHREVFLPQDSAGQELELTLRLWAGLEGGGPPTEQEHTFREAALAVLDEAADNLYYNARAALAASRLLENGEPAKQELLKAVDRAFLLLDWSEPGSEAFYASVAEADQALQQAADGWEHRHAVTVTCIGHTHIDVAWLWRLTHTREKAARSFSTALRLMEQYPDYIFLQTQPQLYEYIKSDYPDIYEQIRSRIAEGRWEAGGAMWLEADCNLTSGESLVRQLLYGTAFLREEFGVECRYLWLPDVFGYSWALPQILKKSGIDTFMTTKISWNQFNRMPHDTFRWRGIDGTEVLTHFVTTPEVPGSTVWWYTYNGQIEPYSVKGIWDTYRDKSINQELLLSYGYGDGGGGVNRDMLEMRRRLEHMPGLPKVVTGRADDYFARLHATVEATDQYVHTWDGELYLEYHRGTYTSQAYNKRMNRKLELLYRDAEWVQSLRAVASGFWTAYPKEQLLAGWKTILRNQFHDIIPGSSIPEVYADSRLEYAEAEQRGVEAWESGTQALRHAEQGEAGAYTVYNSASFPRSEWIRIEGPPSSCAWRDEKDQPLAAEYAQGAWHVYVERVAALGCAVVRWTDGDRSGEAPLPSSPVAAADMPFVWSPEGIETPFYTIRWNETGGLTRIYDKQHDREVLAAGATGNELQVFEDKPKNFEAWDIDLFYQQKMRKVTALQTVDCTALGRAGIEMRFVWHYGRSTIEQKLRAYAHTRRIDFVTEVDWQERQQLLKVAFPVAVRSTEATYDIQFGNVKRPTHWNTSWDYARFETVGHQWVDLSERRYGVSLLNDCKYGHDIKDNVIRLSLIKSAAYPDPLADYGHHAFTYALLPHAGDWTEGRTAQEAWSLNSPLRLAEGASVASGRSLLRTDAEHVMIDAVKQAEDGDGAIVRLHEFTGARGALRLESDFRILSWQECDLMERPTGEKVYGEAIELNVLPYEIRTLRIAFADDSHI